MNAKVMLSILMILQLSPGTQAAYTNVYGLFIGINDGDPHFPHCGDVAATYLYTQFSRNIANFKGSLLTGKSFTRDDIWKASTKVWCGDLDSGALYVFYMAGHGGSQLLSPDLRGETPDATGAKGDESIQIGPNESWYDDELYELLLEMAPGQNRWVLLDGCHTGGFWGDNNPDDIGDLEKLSGVSLFAAAPEEGFAHHNLAGIGNFTEALISALARDTTGKVDHLRADKNADGEVTWEELTEYVQDDFDVTVWLDTVVRPIMPGDPVLFTTDMWNPVAFSTSDSGDGIAGHAIPAPGAIVLAGCGAAMIRLLRQRRRL